MYFLLSASVPCRRKNIHVCSGPDQQDCKTFDHASYGCLPCETTGQQSRWRLEA